MRGFGCRSRRGPFLRGGLLRRALERLSPAEEYLVLGAFLVVAVVVMVGTYWYVQRKMR